MDSEHRGICIESDKVSKETILAAKADTIKKVVEMCESGDAFVVVVMRKKKVMFGKELYQISHGSLGRPQELFNMINELPTVATKILEEVLRNLKDK